MSELLEQIEKLSVREQLELVSQITARVSRGLDEAAWNLAPEDEAELERRVSASKANPLEGRDWPTVKARILADAEGQKAGELAQAA